MKLLPFGIVLLFSLAMKGYALLQSRPLRVAGSLASRKCRNTSSSLRQAKWSSSSLQSTSDSSSNEDIRASRHVQLIHATKLSLAPMMEYTDRHFRHLVRLISKNTLLYTEMVAANALCHERRNQQDEYRALNPQTTEEEVQDNYSDQYLQRYLKQGKVDPLEGASVLQLGGSDPKQMYEAAEVVMDMEKRGWCDYTAINLNCGCPSPKVAGKGCFGAALMDEPKLVEELTRSLHDGTSGTMPITVKCRIGTDSQEKFTKMGYAQTDEEMEYRRLCEFIETIAGGGIVTDFQVHARIAVLQKSFSPADNRKVPPLKYDIVRRLVQDYPELTFSLNGGVESVVQAKQEFDACPDLAGVMIGRSFAADPWSFAMADKLLYNDAHSPKNRLEILQAYGKHADAEEMNGDPSKIRRFIVKAVSPLFAGEPNSKRYRIALDQFAGIPKKMKAEGKTLEGQPPVSELILNAAYEHLSEETLLRSPEESYERKLHEEMKRLEGMDGMNTRSDAVSQWQMQRKEEEENLKTA
ncbi:MAG: hypothetical protein SGBAC_002552 [Bacillariaceae sp.]